MHRGRRLRRTPALRALAAETRVAADQLVAPLFVCEGSAVREPIASMPGHARVSPDLAAGDAARLAALGIRAVLLFGVPSRKDAEGSGAWDADGPGARGHSRDQGRRAVDRGVGRRLPLRVHGPRSLRRA